MRKIIAAFAALALFPLLTADAETPYVDLELVLAVDASGSVDEEEFRLQLSGIAAAFRDPDCLLYTSPSPRDKRQSRMPSSA